METYALRIENLLCKLSPTIKGMRAIIEQNPYEEILKVLNGRTSTKTFERFQLYYQGIKGKTISNLLDEDYDLEKLIADLKYIIESTN